MKGIMTAGKRRNHITITVPEELGGGVVRALKEALSRENRRRARNGQERFSYGIKISGLERLSPPGGQDREAIEIVVREESAESRKKLADAIRDILTEQVRASSLWQQLYPTERTPNQGEELHLGEDDQQSDTPPHP